MKNREWLRAQSEYDLLCGMNERLTANKAEMQMPSNTHAYACIMDCFFDKTETYDFCYGGGTSCAECIQHWLNEERR